MAMDAFTKRVLRSSSPHNKKVMLLLESFDKFTATAGVQPQDNGNVKRPNGDYADITYAQLLSVHEFDHINNWNTFVPKRPILSVSRAEFGKDWSRTLRKSINTVAESSTLTTAKVKKVYRQVANDMARDTRSVIGSGMLEGNTEATVELKGKDSPMDSTGGLKDSISGAVTTQRR
jgi:hypothetical protein